VGESIEVTIPAWAKRTLATLAVILVAVISFAVFEPIQVLPRIRLAPGFAMTAQSGGTFTSEDARGSVTLYTFTHGDCGEECAATNATMAEIADRARGEIDLATIDLNLVTVSFDAGADGPRLDELAAESGADGELWQWAALESDAVPTVIGAGFRVWVDPVGDGDFEFDQTLVLVDGWGVIRGEYQYATLASDADRIIRHIGVLEEEIRNSHGVASFAYEAAHVFLCYP
jgi:protein SCO1/2